MPYFPLNERAKETLNYIRRKINDAENYLPDSKKNEQQQRQDNKLHDFQEQQASSRKHLEEQSLYYTQKVEPFSSDIEAFTSNEVLIFFIMRKTNNL